MVRQTVPNFRSKGFASKDNLIVHWYTQIQHFDSSHFEFTEKIFDIKTTWSANRNKA